MNRLPRAVIAEAVEVIGHGAPRRKVLGQGPPLATGAALVQQPVAHLPHVHPSVTPAVFLWRNVRLNQPPLLIREVTGVRIPFHPLLIGVLRTSQKGT